MPPKTFETFGHHNPVEDDEAIVALAKSCQTFETMNDRNGWVPAIAVEIGVWMGSTTLLLSNLGFRVFAVDHWKASEGDDLLVRAEAIGQTRLFQTFCSNMGSRLYHNVFPLIGASSVIASSWPTDLKINFLLIDGDHTYNGCLADINNYTPLMAPRGIVAIHDYGVFPGVNQAVQETGPFEIAGWSVAWRKV